MLRLQSQVFADTLGPSFSLRARTIRSRKDLEFSRFRCQIGCSIRLQISFWYIDIYFHRATVAERFIHSTKTASFFITKRECSMRAPIMRSGTSQTIRPSRVWPPILLTMVRVILSQANKIKWYRTSETGFIWRLVGVWSGARRLLFSLCLIVYPTRNCSMFTMLTPNNAQCVRQRWRIPPIFGTLLLFCPH